MLSMEEMMKHKNSENDFITHLGIRIVEAGKGYAKCEMDVQPWHANPIGSLHGGVAFTLADTVSGVAAASYGTMMTTVSSNFNYLAPGINVKKIYAAAKEIKHGKTICVFDVEVFSDEDVMLSKGTFTFYNLGTTFK